MRKKLFICALLLSTISSNVYAGKSTTADDIEKKAKSPCISSFTKKSKKLGFLKKKTNNVSGSQIEKKPTHVSEKEPKEISAALKPEKRPHYTSLLELSLKKILQREKTHKVPHDLKRMAKGLSKDFHINNLPQAEDIEWLSRFTDSYQNSHDLLDQRAANLLDQEGAGYSLNKFNLKILITDDMRNRQFSSPRILSPSSIPAGIPMTTDLSNS